MDNAWHFSNGWTRYNTGERIIKGLRLERDHYQLRQTGLRSYRKPIYALALADGMVVSLCKTDGWHCVDADATFSTVREHIEVFDGTDVLLKFAAVIVRWAMVRCEYHDQRSRSVTRLAWSYSANNTPHGKLIEAWHSAHDAYSVVSRKLRNFDGKDNPSYWAAFAALELASALCNTSKRAPAGRCPTDLHSAIHRVASAIGWTADAPKSLEAMDKALELMNAKLERMLIREINKQNRKENSDGTRY